MRSQRRLRARRHRERRKRGAAVAPVEYDGAVITLLIKLQWLREGDEHDAAKVGRAVSALLKDASGE